MLPVPPSYQAQTILIALLFGAQAWGPKASFPSHMVMPTTCAAAKRGPPATLLGQYVFITAKNRARMGNGRGAEVLLPWEGPWLHPPLLAQPEEWNSCSACSPDCVQLPLSYSFKTPPRPSLCQDQLLPLSPVPWRPGELMLVPHNRTFWEGAERTQLLRKGGNRM